MTAPHRGLIRQVAAFIPAADGDDCTLVAVDGVDGAGKSTFADHLAGEVRAEGRAVVQIRIDDFHHRRAVRHARGRDSPDGFWRDSYNYPQFVDGALKPLSRGGSRRFMRRGHEVDSDAVLDPEPETAPPGSVVIVDGLFLQRDELRPYWALAIFLDVPFAVSARRMADRDGSNPDPGSPTLHRYVGGQRLYFEACRPQERVDVLIDYADLEAPRLMRPCAVRPRSPAE